MPQTETVIPETVQFKCVSCWMIQICNKCKKLQSQFLLSTPTLYNMYWFFRWSFVSLQVNIQNPIDNIQRHLSDSSRPWTSSISLMCSSSALVNSGLVAPGRFSDDRLSALVAPPTQEGGTMWQKDTRLRVGCRHQVVTTKTILFCLLFA